jgi:hypothetical protein
MKRSVFGLGTLFILGYSLSVIGLIKIRVSQQPVVIMQQNQEYVATANSTGYYTYSEGSNEYICSLQQLSFGEPNSTSNKQISVRIGMESKTTYCYPADNFDLVYKVST